MQPARRIGVAIGDYVLDLSVIAPLFFTGPNLSAHQQVLHMYTQCYEKYTHTHTHTHTHMYICHTPAPPLQNTTHTHLLGVCGACVKWFYVTGPACMVRGKAGHTKAALQG